MGKLKTLAKKIPLLNKYSKLGYFSPPIRKKIIINFIFQRIFRQNSDCHWSVHYTSTVIIPQNIKIGKGVERSFLLSNGCYIQGGNGIEIGEGTIFAPGVKIISANHNPNKLNEWLPGKPIKIGKNCWIGANVIILAETELGNNVVVGAGSVVTKSFPSDVVIAGNPAKIIKNSKHGR